MVQSDRQFQLSAISDKQKANRRMQKFCVVVFLSMFLGIFLFQTSDPSLVVSASKFAYNPSLATQADPQSNGNQPEGGSQAGAGSEEKEVSGPTWVEVVFSGGPLGTLIILGLAGLSICAVYLVIDQIIALRRKELMPAGLSDDVRDCLLKGNVDQAVSLCQDRPSSLAFVLLHGIEEIPFGWSSVEKATEDALAEQSARLYRKTEYLSVIGNIAPMVGLLGTVLGMILAFHRVATSQGTAAAPELAEGIYQALITTVGGLLVAIPSLGAFAILRNRLDQLVAETAHLTQTVFSSLRTKRKSKASAS